MPELSRYSSPLRFRTISLRFSAMRLVIAWRRAADSNSVRLPTTSIREAGPDCRIVIEKFFTRGGIGMPSSLPTLVKLGSSEEKLLAQNDANDIHLGRKGAKQSIGRRVESQGRRYQINKRRSRLQLDT